MRDLYHVTGSRAFAVDHGLKEQIRRAAVPIMSNVAEGHERDGNKEFLHFLSVAKASSGEVRSHLYVALDQRYISDETFDTLSLQIQEVSRMLSGLLAYLRSSRLRGSKYAPSNDQDTRPLNFISLNFELSWIASALL